MHTTHATHDSTYAQPWQGLLYAVECFVSVLFYGGLPGWCPFQVRGQVLTNMGQLCCEVWLPHWHIHQPVPQQKDLSAVLCPRGSSTSLCCLMSAASVGGVWPMTHLAQGLAAAMLCVACCPLTASPQDLSDHGFRLHASPRSSSQLAQQCSL